MIITKEYIEAQMSPRGGYTRSALAKLGVPWPPPHNWKRKLIGTDTDIMPGQTELVLEESVITYDPDDKPPWED